MTVEHIIPCVCCDHIKTTADGCYYGMPTLKVAGNYIKHLQFWVAECPNCGRGGIFEYKSAYLALKEWNEMQKDLYEMKGKEIVIHDRDYYSSLPLKELQE